MPPRHELPHLDRMNCPHLDRIDDVQARDGEAGIAGAVAAQEINDPCDPSHSTGPPTRPLRIDDRHVRRILDEVAARRKPLRHKYKGSTG